MLTPGQASERELPGYTPPQPFHGGSAEFEKVTEYDRPACAFNVVRPDPCQSWLVNGEPFPQAAPYVIVGGAPPRVAPFELGPDRKTVVYLSRYDHRMTYQRQDETHPLTDPLAGSAVPEVTFARQNRYVALAKNGAQIFDTKTWKTLSIPEARQVHDLNESGIVATTPSKVLVLDHRGRERLSLPVRTYAENVIPDTYVLSPDGRRLVILRNATQVETFDVGPGRRVSRAAIRGDTIVEAVLGWTEQGRLRVRDGWDVVYTLDPMTGDLRRH